MMTLCCNRQPVDCCLLQFFLPGKLADSCLFSSLNSPLPFEALCHCCCCLTVQKQLLPATLLHRHHDSQLVFAILSIFHPSCCQLCHCQWCCHCPAMLSLPLPLSCCICYSTTISMTDFSIMLCCPCVCAVIVLIRWSLILPAVAATFTVCCLPWSIRHNCLWCCTVVAATGWSNNCHFLLLLYHFVVAILVDVADCHCHQWFMIAAKCKPASWWFLVDGT